MKYCMKGVRMFYSLHGLDYNEMLKNGTPYEDLLNTQDVLAKRLVEDCISRSVGSNLINNGAR